MSTLCSLVVTTDLTANWSTCNSNMTSTPISSFYCYENMTGRTSKSSTSDSTPIYPQVSFLEPCAQAECTQTNKLRTLRQRGRVARPKTAGTDKSFSTALNPRQSSSGESVNSDVEFQDWTFGNSSTSLVSASSSLSTGYISPRSTSPVYEALPPITPAYLRYHRDESKRADEHHFGSVASRGTDIARETRWEARMLDLQRRQEAEKEEQESIGTEDWVLEI